MKNAVPVLDIRRLFVANDRGSVVLQCLDVALQCLHHLDRLDVVYRVHGDGSLFCVICRTVAMLVLTLFVIKVLLGCIAGLVVAAGLGGA